MITTLHLTMALASGVPSAAAAPQIDVDAVDALLTSYADDRIYTGEVLIAVGDRVLLHRQYGFRDWSSREPLPENGIYKLGSVTKQFTAAAILKLEADGRLSTSDPVARHIPELPDTLAGSDGKRVTIHHLVTHTSGFPNPIFANFWGPEQGFAALLEAIQEAELRHPPGAEFHYNNSGYAVLGEVIRRVTGAPFEQVLRQELFEPLGMRSSAVKLDSSQRARKARGHVSNIMTLVPSQDSLGRFIRGDYEWDLLANGNVSSSVVDLHRWVRALQEGDLFAPEVMEKMLTPGLRDYAYGWIVRQIEGIDEPLYWHNGAIIPFGYTADLGWTMRGKLVVISLSNLDDTAVTQNVFNNIMRVITGRDVEPPRAGRAANTSYFTIQLMTLVFGSSLLVFLVGGYLVWLLGVRRHRSRLQLYTDAGSALCMAALGAVILGGWLGALFIVAALGGVGWSGWRARGKPLFHNAPWKQWLNTIGAAVSGAIVLGLAALIVYYCGM